MYTALQYFLLIVGEMIKLTCASFWGWKPVVAIHFTKVDTSKSTPRFVMLGTSGPAVINAGAKAEPLAKDMAQW